MAVEGLTPEPILDIEGTLARFGGDKDLFIEMAGILLEDAPCLFEKLRGAVAASDAAAVRIHAHALKGLLAGCGGVRATRAAQSLEDAGETSDLSQTASLMEALNQELDQLTSALRCASLGMQ